MPRRLKSRAVNPDRLRIPSKMDPPEMEGLTVQEAMFVHHWFGDARRNATTAARMCGYLRPQDMGWTLMQRPAVLAAIRAKLDEFAMPIQELLARLSEIARFDPMSCYDNVNGKPVFNLGKAQRLGKTHLIKSITPTKDGLKVEWKDGEAAIDRLMRYHGAYQQNVKVDAQITHRIDLHRLARIPEGEQILDQFIQEKIGYEELVSRALPLLQSQALVIEGQGLEVVKEPAAPEGEDDSG